MHTSYYYSGFCDSIINFQKVYSISRAHCIYIYIYILARDIADVVRNLQTNITSSEFEMVVGRATLLKNAFKRMDKSVFEPRP